MCGVIGIINKEDVAVRLFYGLIALQHRGQDAAGIVTNTGNELFVKKDNGLVRSIFSENDLKELQGNKGIAHTRYSTVGSASKVNSQPLFVNSTNKIAMAHNGNITNYEELKELLSDLCIFFTTTVDIEPLLQLFAIKYEKTKDFFEAARYILEKVNGSYSVVGIIAGKGCLR